MVNGVLLAARAYVQCHTLISVVFSDATGTSAVLPLALASGMRIEACTQIDVGLSRCFQCGRSARGGALVLLAGPAVNTEADADACEAVEIDSKEEEEDRDGDGATSDWVTASAAALAAVAARLFSSFASMRR